MDCFPIVLIIHWNMTAVMGDFSMPSWAFHPIIQTVLQQWSLLQKCGIPMVGCLSNCMCLIFDSYHWSMAWNQLGSCMNYSLSRWTSMHINSPSSWWGPKWIWACKWALDANPYGNSYSISNSLHFFAFMIETLPINVIECKHGSATLNKILLFCSCVFINLFLSE